MMVFLLILDNRYAFLAPIDYAVSLPVTTGESYEGIPWLHQAHGITGAFCRRVHSGEKRYAARKVFFGAAGFNRPAFV
jgi:hypothetical protein